MCSSFCRLLPWVGAHDSSRLCLLSSWKRNCWWSCRNKGAGTPVSALAGWDGAQDLLDQTKQPKWHLPGELLVWIFWSRGSGINWFLKAASFAVVVPSPRTAPLLQQWFPQGQKMERGNQTGWMEPFDSVTPWFVQLGWWGGRNTPQVLDPCVWAQGWQGELCATTGSWSCHQRCEPKGRLGFSAAPSALQGSPGGNLLSLCFSTAK